MSPCTSKPRKKIEQILLFLEEIHTTLERAIKGLENRELNWRPSPKSNTIGNLLKHIMGAEAFWIHHVVGGMETQRVRTSEFKVKEFQIINLREEIVHVKEMTKKVMEKLTDEQLAELRIARKKRTTVYWCLIHIIEHSAQHIGQIFYIRKMYADLRNQT